MIEMAVEPEAPPTGSRRPTFVRWYVGAATLLLNTFVLFAVLNLVLWPILGIRHFLARPSYLKYPDSWYRTVYPTMADPDWKELVRETKERPFNSEPYVMFTEPPYHGRYINVADQGYRLAPQQGPWPMDPKNYNVLTFGGSTMFGYGVADDQTIPAYIQGLLQSSTSRRVCVYNFGRRGYFSTQERILCEQLLRDGARPNLVIFLDGLNDFVFGVDPNSLPQNRDDSLTPPSSGNQLVAFLESLPVGEVAQTLSRKYIPSPKSAPPLDWQTADPIAIDRYVWNKSAIGSICKSMGIATVFVFQPTPIYEYDLTGHILKITDWTLPGDQYTIRGYPLMAQYVKDHDMGDDFLWLADMQQGIHKLLYVDKWHYSPDFSRQIAGEICKSLEARKQGP
jgi:lysophospholipase L1-like esterase